MEAARELQDLGNMKLGMYWPAAACERTVAKSWILPKFKGRLCQVAGFVPPVAESSLCFLTSGHQLQLEDSSNAQAQGGSSVFVPDASTSVAPQATGVSTFIHLLGCSVVSQLGELIGQLGEGPPCCSAGLPQSGNPHTGPCFQGNQMQFANV